MYNQSNAITCLKIRIKLYIYTYIMNCTYLLKDLKHGNTYGSTFNSILKKIINPSVWLGSNGGSNMNPSLWSEDSKMWPII